MVYEEGPSSMTAVLLPAVLLVGGASDCCMVSVVAIFQYDSRPLLLFEILNPCTSSVVKRPAAVNSTRSTKDIEEDRRSDRFFLLLVEQSEKYDLDCCLCIAFEGVMSFTAILYG